MQRGLTSSSRDRSNQGQRRMAPDIPSSFTSPSTSGVSEATQHQRGRVQAAPGSSTSVSGHSQYAAIGNGAPGPPRSSINIFTTHGSNRQEHALLGLTSLASNAGQGQYRPYMPPPGHMQQAYNCPYHGPILQGGPAYPHPGQGRLADPRSGQGSPADPRYGQGLGPMNRYLNEGPSEQHAMFYRADTGALSTNRGCHCYKLTQSIVPDPKRRHQ